MPPNNQPANYNTRQQRPPSFDQQQQQRRRGEYGQPSDYATTQQQFNSQASQEPFSYIGGNIASQLFSQGRCYPSRLFYINNIFYRWYQSGTGDR